MGKRLFGWWFVAEDALRLLTVPRPDIGRGDRAVEELFRESWLFTRARELGTKTERAWENSRVIAAIAPFAAELFPPGAAARVRVTGVLTCVASVTALAIQSLKPIPAGPLTWIVPALTAVSGAVIALAAAPIARALEDKRR